MKKVMLSAAVCAMAFSANADVSEEVVVEEAAQTSDFNSFYFGAGIGGSFLKSDDVGITKGMQGTANGIRIEGDRAVFTDFTSVSREQEKFGVKANRFIGSFVIGGGRVFSNNVYVGGEFLMDVSKDKKISRESKIKANLIDNSGIGDNVIVNGKSVGEWKSEVSSFAQRKDVKVGGFIPQFNLKAGYVFKNNTLVYGKLGCALTKVSIDSYYKKSGSDEWIKDKDESWSKTKPSLILGLGAEKSFGKKFSAAVEADYNFGWKHKGYKANKGWNVRALVKYNVKY
ncbi:MAG: hypothetical protein K5766_00560 [Alphaproteobacteria bacterium]|nr:hypothetical protein [Alphaproteobacteria bacterium]